VAIRGNEFEEVAKILILIRELYTAAFSSINPSGSILFTGKKLSHRRHHARRDLGFVIVRISSEFYRKIEEDAGAL